MAKHLKELTLSTFLNGLATHARLPTLTKLTVDFSSRNQFVSVPKSSFPNVRHLAIRARQVDILPMTATIFSDQGECAVIFSQKLNILVRNLPSVRTLEFECGTVASHCKIPPHVEKVVLRPLTEDAEVWLASIGNQAMEGRFGGMGIKTIEVWHGPNECKREYWPEYIMIQEGIELVFANWEEA